MIYDSTQRSDGMINAGYWGFGYDGGRCRLAWFEYDFSTLWRVVMVPKIMS